MIRVRITSDRGGEEIDVDLSLEYGYIPRDGEFEKALDQLADAAVRKMKAARAA